MNDTGSVNISRLVKELEVLASFTDCPQTIDPTLPAPQRAVTRIVYTSRDLEARSWIKGLARAAGLSDREDPAGNTFFRWEGSAPELPAIGTGSHVDAIPFAGMYDGTVGVLGGLEAIRSLQAAGFQPRRSLELVLFTSEEPTRFGAGCLGSRLLSGQLASEAADALPDRLHETDASAVPGGTLASARHGVGFVGSLSDVFIKRPQYAAWLELHIEQGPLLERSLEDLGIVTHIAGPASYRYTVQGLGGHAGALLMPDRRDALCASAELVLAAERAALQANAEPCGEPNSVATVGKLEVHPGAVNAVPSRVDLMLDVRDTDTTRRESMMRSLRAAVHEIEDRRGVFIREDAINADEPVTCDVRLTSLLERLAGERGFRTRRLVSRAYHDTTFMARIAPVAMLFIPCRNGVSHRPDEYATPEAIARGVEVLSAAMRSLSLDGMQTASGTAAGVD